jgi:hypothetical protein
MIITRFYLQNTYHQHRKVGVVIKSDITLNIFRLHLSNNLSDIICN